MVKYDILIDYSGKETPILVYARTTTPVPHNGYHVGSKSDPHWKPYPKSAWPQGQSQTPVGTLLTNYDWDAANYAMYVSDPNKSPITYDYVTALKQRVFDPVKDYREQAARDSFAANVQNLNQIEIQRRQMEEQQKTQIKDRIKQLKSVGTEQTNYLRSLEEEFQKMQGDAARDVREMRGRGGRGRISEADAQKMYLDTLNPLTKQRAVQLESTINIVKQNLKSLSDELTMYNNEYKKLK